MKSVMGRLANQQ